MSEKRCEVCGESGGVIGVELETRVIALCKTDARRAREGGAKTLDDMRRLFVEGEGRRALLPRRADERRVFPPRPEGRRHDDGRRGSDSA